ncbi:MAG: FAD-dependent monooxygenase [Actinomycetota bacterium]|nr:FAD-dependent monooxygenase [Actinomycetota bacterium]
MSNPIETDVLVVGSGPAGSAAALFLSAHGVEHTVVTKYRWTSNTPRSHITNQRTVEILRNEGLEDEVKRLGTPQPLMGDTVFCTSLAGEEFARLHTWGTHPQRLADYTLASPSIFYDLPQNILEPILLGNAAERGSKVRFNTEYLSLVQDDEGVTATVRDRVTGEEYEIRAKYLIGADGGRSKVAEDIGLPMEGAMDLAGSMNIIFKADLSQYVAHRPSVLYWILQPGSAIGGIGLGLCRMVRPWNEWLIVWGYDIEDEPPELTEAEATKIAHNLIGDDTIPLEITSTSLWTNNRMWAGRYSEGRVHCMGDACHRHPPSNGLGSNTSIQDAYNLTWKLALVLDGKADPALLDSFNEERAPIGEQIVKRANQSIDEFGPIFEALGLLEKNASIDQIKANIEARKEDTPEAAEQRRKLKEAIELKNYEFNAHGVEMNHRYRSVAVIPDGSPEPEFHRDPELYYHATTWSGARMPHCWLEQEGRKVSTIDLVGHGRFTLLTSIGGDRWVEAAKPVSKQAGIEIAAYLIGPGREVMDTYDDWARIREVEEGGCLLVRPDMHIAWRSHELVEDPAAALAAALESILHPQRAESAQRISVGAADS